MAGAGQEVKDLVVISQETADHSDSSQESDTQVQQEPLLQEPEDRSINQVSPQPSNPQIVMAQLFNVPFPDKLDLPDDSCADKSGVWEMFKQMWDNYEISSGLIDHAKGRRAATLLTCFTPSSLKVFNSLPFATEAERKDIDVVLRKMSEHCKGVTNETYERYLFNTRSQGEREGINEFYAALLKQSKTCSYGDLADSLIRDRIVVGIRDADIRKRLLQRTDLKLEDCLKLVRAHEATSQQLQSMQAADVSYAGAGQSKFRHKNKPKFDKKGAASSDKKCPYCGRASHPRSKCPARDVDCNKCGKKGHFGIVCRSKEKKVQEVTEEEPAFLGAIHSKNSGNWDIDILVDGELVSFKVDTGADVNIISGDIYRDKFKDRVLLPANKSLRGVDRKPLPVLGYFKSTLVCEGKRVSADVYIIEGATPLLSRNCSVDLNIIKFIHSVEQYKDVFTGLGEMKDPYEIKIEDNAKPFSVCSPRRIALPLMSKVKEELDRLEKLNVITRVTEPTEWCAPIVVVPKSTGKIRLCVDYTKLNQCVKRERHMLPTVDHALGQMAGAKVMSKLDANSGFHQIKLTENSKSLTTFITPYGRYRYERLPFGINSGPEHYQRQVHQVLENQEGVVCLMDDIVVFGRDEKEHDRRLEQVLEKLSQANVTLNREKCEDEDLFLGPCHHQGWHPCRPCEGEECD